MIGRGLVDTYCAVLLGVLGLPAASHAQFSVQSGSANEPTKLRLLANVDYVITSRTFDDTTTFDAFLEQGTTRRTYDGSGGPGFEVGIIYNFTPALGVLASFELHNLDHDGTLELTSPHPLYFNQSRSATDELPGLSYSEQALNVDIVYTADASPKIAIDVFGGATFFFTETELIDEPVSQSVYPFDELTLTSPSTVKVTDNPIGFNAGAAVTYRLTPVFGVSFQARFSQGSLDVSRDGGSSIQLDAGGFRVGGGIRLSF